MKQPKALPTLSCPTHGPYAFSMAAAVNTTNATTTRIMTFTDMQDADALPHQKTCYGAP